MRGKSHRRVLGTEVVMPGLQRQEEREPQQGPAQGMAWRPHSLVLQNVGSWERVSLLMPGMGESLMWPQGTVQKETASPRRCQPQALHGGIHPPVLSECCRISPQALGRGKPRLASHYREFFFSPIVFLHLSSAPISFLHRSQLFSDL